MGRLVILLRGINVGGHKRISMADLRKLLEARGYAGVRTHLQSGNVVVGTERDPASVEADVSAAIAEALGHDVAVVVRTGDELAELVAADPFADVRHDPRFHQVVFLGGEPDADAIKELEATDFSPERLVVAPGVLHAWCPDGVNDSPLMKALTRVRTTATARNWRTVEKLAEMASAAE
jgi:uncharacterized protein (DUF1697 family)